MKTLTRIHESLNLIVFSVEIESTLVWCISNKRPVRLLETLEYKPKSTARSSRDCYENEDKACHWFFE